MDKEQLLSTEVRAFIRKHENDDLSTLMLRRDKYPDLPLSDIADQITSRKKARHKLPSWYSNEDILYPQPVSIEQSSSEITAQWKANYIGSGKNGADLTGGFGVDSLYLAKKFDRWTYLEKNKELLEVVEHNFEVLGANNIDIRLESAEEYLNQDIPSLKLIYIDPDRRPGTIRVSSFKDSRPNISALLPEIKEITSEVLIKASPMIDIRAGLNELAAVSNVIVLSINNEVKEVLFHLDFRQSEEIKYRCVNLTKEKEISFEYYPSDHSQEVTIISELSSYLYEPNASIMKCGGQDALGVELNLKKLHRNTNLYTSSEIINDFPGRVFEVLGKEAYSRNAISQYLKDGKANLSTRNFVDTPDQMKKKLKLSDGGDYYVFGYRDWENRNKIAICKKA